jgi:hypothetical protein
VADDDELPNIRDEMLEQIRAEEVPEQLQHVPIIMVRSLRV